MGVNAVMFVVLNEAPTSEQLEEWNGELWIYRNDFGRLRPVPGTDEECPWRQIPEGGAALEVQLDYQRFYGPGYERGPIEAFVGLAETLEAILPVGTRIFYGGDCSDTARPFDRSARDMYMAHRRGPNGDAYHEAARAWNAKHGTKT